MGIIKRNSISITILSYVGVVVGFVNQILLLPNLMSEEQVGLIGTLILVATMYAQFSAMGVHQTVVRFFPFFKTRKDNSHNGLFAWAVLVISAGFILFTAIFLLLKKPVTAYYATNALLFSENYLLVIPLTLTLLFNLFFGAWLQALHKTVISSFAYDVLLRLLITAEITLFALGILNFEQFLIGYIIIHYVPTLVLLIYAVAIGQVSLKINFRPRTRKLFAMAWRYGFWLFLSGASLYIIPVVDQLMLAGMISLAAGGIYSRMIHVVSFIMVPYRSLIKVSTPVVADLWKERRMDEMAKLYRNVSLTNLIIGCFFFMIVWINLDNLFAVLPESYAQGRYVFLFLGLGRVFDMYAGLNGTILVTSKKYRSDFYFSLLLVALTIGTNIVLIPIWGMVGAALATMSAAVVWNLLRIIAVWKYYRIQPFAWVDTGVVLLSAALIGLSMLIPQMGNFISDTLIRTLFIGLLFCGIMYRWHIAPDLNATADNILRKLHIIK